MNYQEWYDKYVDREEGIISNLFNKNKNIRLKDITNQKINIINQSFKNDNIRNIALNTNIKSIKLGGNKAYHRQGNIVLKENYTKRTVIHEIGHAVDYNNKWLSSNKLFVEAINKDREYILKNKSLYKRLIQNNIEYAEFSDIVGGMTNNKIVGIYKHDKIYWKKNHKLQRETFAQIFTIAGRNDIKQLELFQKYLPNTFREFDNLIRRLL